MRALGERPLNTVPQSSEPEAAAIADLVARQREKDELLAGLIHDLRNPLNVILSWTHLLREGRLDDATFTRAVDSLQRHAELQARMLASFVDYTSLVDGNTELERRPAALAPLVMAAVAGARPQARSKPIGLEPHLDDHQTQIPIDEEWMGTALRAMLAHAVDATPAAGRLDVSLRETETAVEVEVAHTGEPLSPAEIERLFEPVGPSDRSRGRGNLKLDLAIADRVARLHGGTLVAMTGGDGQGACYVLRLPRPTPAGADAPTASAS